MPHISSLGAQLQLEKKVTRKWKLTFCSFIPGKVDSEWSSGMAPGLPWSWCVIVFLVLGLGRECGCGWFVHHCFFFFTTWAQTLPFPIFFFVSGDAKLRLWCSRLESDSVFLLVITLFYTPLLLVLLVLVFVFLTLLMAFFSMFLFGPIISTFIPLSLERKEISCLEFNFQLVSNYNIKK